MADAVMASADKTNSGQPDSERTDSGEDIFLWPGVPPGCAGDPAAPRIRDFGPLDGHAHERVLDIVGRPFMRVFRPAKPNGAGLLIMPGGGYEGLWFDKEGYEIAARFAEAGITGFALLYRLPGEAPAMRETAPLADAQRAMRLIRARAGDFGVDPARLGVMGFSAGGHLAASLATRSGEAVYSPADDADRLSARPDFVAPVYPVVTMGPGTHQGSRDALLGKNPAEADVAAASCEKRVAAGTPPVFLACAADDGAVPFAANSLAFYRALLGAGVPAELHVFEHGGHGFALRLPPTADAARWPELFLAWAGSHGVLKSA